MAQLKAGSTVGGTAIPTSLANLGVTATATELNTLDGITATTTELNYVDGVTSNIQTQLDSKENSLLVAEYTFSTDANSVTFNGLDINADGGVYDVVMSGFCSSNQAYYIEYNNIGSDTNYYSLRLYYTPSGVSSQGESNATAGFSYTQSSLNTHTISLPNGRPSCVTANVIVSTTPTINALYYAQTYLLSQTNITSLTFKHPSANFKTGTTIKIYKRGQ